MGGPNRLPYTILNWPVLLELNSCDTGASRWGSRQSFCTQLMFLMSASSLSTHLHNVSYKETWAAKRMVSTLCRFLRTFTFSHLVFMNLGVVYIRNSSFLCVSTKIITIFMPKYICFSMWLLILLLNYLPLIQAHAQYVLHECILPPIGKLLAPHLMPTIVHYLRCTVYLCSAQVGFPTTGSEDP